MLPKKNRLSRREINFIYQKGKNQNYGFLGIKFVANRLGYSRFAVIVPQKVVKKAVARNRIRRLIFTEIQKKPLGAEGRDCLIRLFQPAEDEATLKQKISEVLVND